MGLRYNEHCCGIVLTMTASHDNYPEASEEKEIKGGNPHGGGRDNHNVAVG